MSATTAYIPVSEVLVDAGQELRDDDWRMAGGRPYYLSQAQRGLQQICYDAMWDERQADLPTPENLILTLPPDLIGLKAVWMYNGTDCNVNCSDILYIKPNMFHRGGAGFFANNTGQGNLLNYGDWWTGGPAPACLYFAGEYKGKLYMSQSCLSYPQVHLTYYGLGIDDYCEDFQVPQWAREAITDFVIHKAALRLRRDNPNLYRDIIREKESMLSDLNVNGTWHKAQVRWGRMDQKERDDLIAQTHRFGHPPR